MKRFFFATLFLTLSACMVHAQKFTEADKTVYLSALLELGLVLFVVTVLINILGKAVIKKFSIEI